MPLYPEQASTRNLTLDVGNGHSLYIETSGSASGIPVIFLHGGPGSGCHSRHRRFFDPEKYFVVLFDQRGCGLSRPRGETRHNTTWDLLGDIELIRAELGISQWLVFGGSWGAALALVYAQHHPAQVSGLVLRGTFLARPEDLSWFAQHGASELFPEAWQRFVEEIPAEEQTDLVAAYYRRLHSKDKTQQEKFARRWNNWSSQVACHNLHSQTEASKPSGPDDASPTRIVDKVKIETHYAIHHYFLDESPILENLHLLPDVPITIAHGQLDQVCPIAASRTLAGKLPNATLIEVPNAGHLAEEPAISEVLVEACDEFVRLELSTTK